MSAHAALTQPAPPIASYHRQTKVPFITAWSGEDPVSPPLIWCGDRIGYRREQRGDRGSHGVLWRRMLSAPGQGKPRFGWIHNRRQRLALGGLLCQVCATPTRPEATADGVLFLLGREDYDLAPWPAPIQTTHPPVCMRCAMVSVKSCPYLRNQYVAVRCRAPRIVGVDGYLYGPRRGEFPERVMINPVRTVLFDSDETGRVHAGQSVAQLDHYTRIDLETESAALAA